MNWLIVSLVAYFLYAVVFILDKFILARPVRSPVVYASYVGFGGILSVLIIPFFNFEILDTREIIYSILAGALFVWGLIYFYKVLQTSETSRIVPLLGVLIALATLFFGYFLGIEKLYSQYLFAFLFLLVGGLLISLGYGKGSWTYQTWVGAAVAAILLGASFVLTKLVFNETDFLSGFVWTRLGGFIFSLLLLFIPHWRKEIWSTTTSVKTSGAVLFFFDKIFGSAGMVLQNYAIFLGSVALVNALQSTQFIFVLILASLLSLKFPRIFHETIGRKEILRKLLAIVIIGIGLWLLVLPVPGPRPLSFGVTFSQKFAEELGLDGRDVYLKILDELKPKNLRLIAYWDLVEPEEAKFDFADLDWQVEEAEKRGAEVILVMGRKTPRWPECHVPNWIIREFPISNFQFSKKEEDYLLGYIRKVVERYKNSSAIWAWQVENEPLFPFGQCGFTGLGLLHKEMDLVRSLDSRPIILTDSGELGFAWPLLAAKADVFGTTLYRYVHHPNFGYFRYSAIPASYFRFKSWWARNLFKKQIIISELQAEPWEVKPLTEVPLADQYRTMNSKIFREVIDYAEYSGFPKAYLWGAEWWYWLKVKQGDDSFWEEAKTLFKK